MDRGTRKAALAALKSGTLTFDEVVKHTGVSRSTVFRWCKVAGMDWRLRRAERAAREWRRLTEVHRDKPSKKLLRQAADMASVEWDLRHEP